MLHCFTYPLFFYSVHLRPSCPVVCKNCHGVLRNICIYLVHLMFGLGFSRNIYLVDLMSNVWSQPVLQLFVVQRVSCGHSHSVLFLSIFKTYTISFFPNKNIQIHKCYYKSSIQTQHHSQRKQTNFFPW